MTRRGPASLVLGLALVFQGCAGLIAGKESAEAPPAPVPGAPAVGGAAAQVEKGRAGLVIAALHGSADTGTDVIGRDLAKLTGWGLVVVTGEPPLDARELYQPYRRQVAEAAQGPLRLYVELHGTGRQESASRLEIATVGVSRDDAWRLKTLLELIRDSRVPPESDVPRLDVRIESLDPLRYAASAATRSGVLGQVALALRIEIPRAARTTHREAYTTVLADFLIQSASLLLAPPR